MQLACVRHKPLAFFGPTRCYATRSKHKVVATSPDATKYTCWYSKPVAVTTLNKEFPTVTWQPWKVAKQSKEFWEEVDNRRGFLEWIFVELGLQVRMLLLHSQQSQSLEDFYQALTTRHFQMNGASELFQKYNSSALEVLRSVFPETNWIPWRFQAHKIVWDRGNQLSFLCW
jgi:hypothetical protein